MTTIPTEEEIVARAINDVLPTRWQRGGAQKDQQLSDCMPLSKAAISALDQYRAKNAGEVGVDTIVRTLQYWIDFDSEHRSREGLETTDDAYITAPPSWPTHGMLKNWIALISSMRSVIEEKDRALRPFVDYLNAIDPQDFASDESEIGIEIIGPFRRAIKFRDLRLTRSTISDGVK